LGETEEDPEKAWPFWSELLSWTSGSETQEEEGLATPTPRDARFSLNDAQVTKYRPVMIKEPPMMLSSHACWNRI